MWELTVALLSCKHTLAAPFSKCFAVHGATGAQVQDHGCEEGTVFHLRGAELFKSKQVVFR